MATQSLPEGANQSVVTQLSVFFLADFRRLDGGEGTALVQGQWILKDMTAKEGTRDIMGWYRLWQPKC